LQVQHLYSIGCLVITEKAKLQNHAATRKSSESRDG